MTDKNKEILDTTDQELLKALQDILGSDNVSEEDIKKSDDKDEDDEGKKGEEEDSDEEMEKAYALKKGELEAMEAKMAAKKSKKVVEKSEEGSDESTSQKADESSIEKAEPNELVKSLMSSLDDIQKSLSAQTESNDEIRKSLGEVKEENIELRKSLEEIGSQRVGMKSMNNVHFIEKGEKEDEDGKKILSVNSDKGKIQDILDKAIDNESDDTISKSLSSDLMSYNMGGAPLSESTAMYLFKKQNIRLVK